MNRIIISLSIIFIFIFSLSGAYYYLSHTKWKPFRGYTHLNSHIVTKEGKRLELNLDISIVAGHEGSSEVLMAGSLKGAKNDYVIYRRIFITMKQSDFKGFNKSIITREERHPIDDVPDKIWQQYVLPEAPDVAFYIETKHLNNNAYLIKGLTNPYFIFTKTSN
ncbi:TPA: hypothetical protein SML50_000115 [Serratia fonticola]|nr:hypothetical protein [Serratia fonticola]